MATSTSTTEFSELTLARREEANALAHRLIKARCGIRQVCLFGSLARGNVKPTSDLDLILVMRDSWTAARWMNRVARELPAQPLRGTSKTVRRDWAARLLTTSELRLDILQMERLDVFLLPTYWREKLSTFHEFWPGWDGDFLYNMSHEAIPYSYPEGFDFPLSTLPTPKRAEHVSSYY